MKKFDASLYFITDSTGFTEDEFLFRVEEALKGGVTLLQLREKNKTAREYLSLAKKVHVLTVKYNVPLIINDRADIAAAAGAEGVHLGQSDMPVADARRLLGDGAVIGATAKTVPQALEAYSQGADQLGSGAVFPSPTKDNAAVMSVETLREICNSVPIPVNAIGGLNKDNLDVLAGVPVAGICAASAVMRAGDPRQAARELKARARELGLFRSGL